MPLALGLLWRCHQAVPWSQQHFCPNFKALAPMFALYQLQVLPGWVPRFPVPQGWFEQPQITKNNKLGLISICFLHCWPSLLESFVNSFIPSSLEWNFDLIALIPEFLENLWSVLHSNKNMDQGWSTAACSPFPSHPVPETCTHRKISAFEENFYLRHHRSGVGFSVLFKGLGGVRRNYLCFTFLCFSISA